MRERLMVIATSMVLMVGGAQLLAHDEFRVSGTILSRQGMRLEVKTQGGRKVLFRLTEGTRIWRGKENVAVIELRPGRTVVVDAYGHGGAESLALGVRIVAAVPSSATGK